MLLRLLTISLLAGSWSVTVYSYLPAGLDLVPVVGSGVESLLVSLTAFLAGLIFIHLLLREALSAVVTITMIAGISAAGIAILAERFAILSPHIPADHIARFAEFPGVDYLVLASLGYGLGALLALILARLFYTNNQANPDLILTPSRQRIQVDPDAAPPAWLKGQNELPAIFDQIKAVKNYPHIYNKLKTFWGYPEFFDYIDKLLTMEQGREGRQGFDARLHSELINIRQYFLDNVEQTMAFDLSEDERKRIRSKV